MFQPSEKKLLQIFKTFFEKTICPQIKKFQGSLSQWTKLSSMLFIQNPNYNEVQIYVDSLPVWGTTSLDKNLLLNKRSNESDNQNTGFNPSKTFGGEKIKSNILPLYQDKLEPTDSKRQIQKQQSLRQRVNQNNNIILTNLQKLLKSLEENQKIIDNKNIDVGSNIQQKLNRQKSNQKNSNNFVPINNGHNNQSNGNDVHNHTYNQQKNSNTLAPYPHSHSHSLPHANSLNSTSTFHASNPVIPANPINPSNLTTGSQSFQKSFY